MKANELMVEDWIGVGKSISNMDGDYDIVYNNEQLTLEHFKFWADNDWDANDFNEFLEPIPLTPEILEKNGFKAYGESWYLPNDNESETVIVGFHMYNTIIDVKKGDDNFFKTVPCKYRSCAENRHVFVHELQNALRICGIEKEFVL